ncbi:porin family protein [Marinomonas posidonica]|uniref:Outer membrane protein beta-barrel domain-containing protein n=1 Tax=Marinomonas posidonica (strain CECT 7376 / NCIMB 14433 / IVIA-Po-181) TaxID=491952 RepID=F6D0N0_MARPP|nr:porin family protein [Marinomonas posidonica]AEF54828.1 hypothetical protein Mar181_1790 [Marinomonas posidonica IVIA-Po-181]
MKNHVLFSIALLLATGTVSAQSARNAISAELGLGSLEYGNSIEDIDDSNSDVSWSGSLFFERGLTPYIGLSIGLHTGEGSSLDINEAGTNATTKAELKYQAVSVSAISYFHFSSVNRLYGAAGINYNTVELNSSSNRLLDESGVGFNVRVGWEHQFSQTLSMSVGIQRLSLEKIDVNTTNIGVKMSF